MPFVSLTEKVRVRYSARIAWTKDSGTPSLVSELEIDSWEIESKAFDQSRSRMYRGSLCLSYISMSLRRIVSGWEVDRSCLEPY